MSAPQFKPDDVELRIAAWFLGRPVQHEATKYAAQVLTMLSDLRLVVIDPEDREQVERLASAYVVTWAINNPPTPGTIDVAARQMQAALRSLVSAPHCDVSITIGGVVIECERAEAGHLTDHRNDSIGQGVRWSA